MKKITITLLPILLILSLTAFSCKKSSSSSPVEPPTHGTIKGTTTDFGTGYPLEGVNIYSEPASSFVKTDVNGNYQISTVEPGTYKVVATKISYDTLAVNVTVVAGATAVADFILVKSDTTKNKNYGQITGIVKNSKTFIPIENVNLTTLPVTSSITSDATGKYTFVNVSPGTYTLFAKKVGYDSTSISVNVIAGQITKADIYLTEQDTTVPPTTGSIVGEIQDAQTLIAIPGALVSTNPATSTVFSTNSGSYSFTNIPPGDYTVSVSKIGYQNSTAKITVIVGNESRADFMLVSATGSIVGTVTDDSTHLPIAGVNIQTQPGTASITSDSLGHYTFDKISPANYSIKATASGYQDAALSVVVTAGNVTQADISMIANK